MDKLKIMLLLIICGLLILREIQIQAVTQTLIDNQSIINNNANRLNSAALKQNDEILQRLTELKAKVDELADKR